MTEARKKLIANSIVDEKSGCWFCKLAKDYEGYVRIWFQGRIIRAHRLAYLAFKGEIPKGLCVCHRCNNPACVNPEHLYLDTNAGNSKYMIECGRSIKGEKNPMFGNVGDKHPRAKLIESQVREVFSLRAKGLSHRKIGQLVGISHRQVGNILRGKSWPHIVL